jgi:hypothetical protein
MDSTHWYATAMVAERVIVGGAAIVAPGQLLTGFGAPADLDTPAVRYTTRLFGIRNVALGLQVWQARQDPARLRALATQNAAVELTDLVAGAALAKSAPQLRTPAIAVMVTSVAVASGFLGLRALANRG